LSQPWSTSDGFKLQERKVVPTLVNFGQVYAEKEKNCPNLGQLRTDLSCKREKLSQPWSTSDSFKLKKRKVVPTLVNFGQVYAEKEKNCPNLGQLRTDLSCKREKLSQPWSETRLIFKNSIPYITLFYLNRN
jgi:hypothetical protein